MSAPAACWWGRPCWRCRCRGNTLIQILIQIPIPILSLLLLALQVAFAELLFRSHMPQRALQLAGDCRTADLAAEVQRRFAEVEADQWRAGPSGPFFSMPLAVLQASAPCFCVAHPTCSIRRPRPAPGRPAASAPAAAPVPPAQMQFAMERLFRSSYPLWCASPAGARAMASMAATVSSVCDKRGVYARLPALSSSLPAVHIMSSAAHHRAAHTPASGHSDDTSPLLRSALGSPASFGARRIIAKAKGGGRVARRMA